MKWLKVDTEGKELCIKKIWKMEITCNKVEDIRKYQSRLLKGEGINIFGRINC